MKKVIQVDRCHIGTSSRPPEDLVIPGKIWVVTATDGEVYFLRDTDCDITAGGLLTIGVHRRQTRFCFTLHMIIPP